MWGAIKSDLFEFISTVQEDAQDTISKVVDIPTSRTAADNDKITEDERILSEFRNNLATYAEVQLILGLTCLASGDRHTFALARTDTCMYIHFSCTLDTCISPPP